jgi:hypothetical protein
MLMDISHLTYGKLKTDGHEYSSLFHYEAENSWERLTPIGGPAVKVLKTTHTLLLAQRVTKDRLPLLTAPFTLSVGDNLLLEQDGTLLCHQHIFGVMDWNNSIDGFELRTYGWETTKETK